MIFNSRSILHHVRGHEERSDSVALATSSTDSRSPCRRFVLGRVGILLHSHSSRGSEAERSDGPNLSRLPSRILYESSLCRQRHGPNDQEVQRKSGTVVERLCSLGRTKFAIHRPAVSLVRVSPVTDPRPSGSDRGTVEDPARDGNGDRHSRRVCRSHSSSHHDAR